MLMTTQENLSEPSCPLWFKFLSNEKCAAVAAARWKTLVVQLLATEILRVLLRVFFPFFRQIIQRENGRHRTHRHARATIDALDRVNEQHLGTFKLRFVLLGMDAIHRACIHAGRVLGPDARLCNHICHKSKGLRISISCVGQPRILPAIVKRANFSAEWQPERVKKPGPASERGAGVPARDSGPARCDT